MAATTEAIDVEDLTVRFGTLTAFEGVTYRFEPGSSTAVMGVNGSGKTTLLECLAGLLHPTTGRISGVPNKIAYLRQHLHTTWMPLTANEVIAMGRYRERGFIKRLRPADRKAINTASEKLNVTRFANRSFGSLSGGQQQRVRIAQALASDPDVILLDEPVTGLDIPSRECILGVLGDYSDQGTTVIVTTHHFDEAWRCQTVMLMENRLVASGTPEEMLPQIGCGTHAGNACLVVEPDIRTINA